MREQDLITQAQAATILRRSVSAISRAVKAGRLKYADPKRRLFSRPGLEVRYANHTPRRVDQPMVKTQKAAKDHCEVLIEVGGRPPGLPLPSAPERTIPETYWDRVADKLDCVLQGCSQYWPEYDAEIRDGRPLFQNFCDEPLGVWHNLRRHFSQTTGVFQSRQKSPRSQFTTTVSSVSQ